jgi:hypothetical protein
VPDAFLWPRATGDSIPWFVRSHVTAYCIFQEPWWLDAVAAGHWQSLEVTGGDRIAARMPIVLHRKYGFRIIREPPLTPTLGPWLHIGEGNPAARMAEQKDLMNGLIAQLPEWDYFEVNLNHCITNWLPFYWKGFKQTTRYTYILDDLSDIEKVWSRLHKNVRRHVRKASKRLSIRTDLSIDRALDLVELTFRRQGRPLPYPRDIACRIDAACAARDARRMLFAEDAEGRIHAAVYLVIDSRYAYYLFGGADPELRGSDAQSLLLWEAIRIAAEMGRKFDFEGSMIEPIERVFREFGAAQVPYLQVYGAKPLVALLLQACPRRLIRKVASHL